MAAWRAADRAANRPDDPCYGVKDPSIVRHGEHWHLFSTIRSQKRARQIVPKPERTPIESKV